MNQSTKWVVGVIVVVAIVAVGYFVSKGPSEPASTEPIKIGFVAPLSGEAAAYGESERDGVMIAVDEINKKGGVNGKQIVVIYEDGKCNGKDATSAAQKLVNIDEVKMIIGGGCSGEVFGMAPITEAAKVIVLSPSASNPKITEIGDYVFRNHPNDNDAGKQLADVMYKVYKKAAVISENTEYAQGIKGSFIDNYKTSGGTVVFDESFIPETNDFRSVLSKLKATNPEAIFINPQAGGAAYQIAKQARELGLKQQFYIAYLSGPDYVVAGPEVEGTILIDVPGLTIKNPQAAGLLNTYQARYNKRPNYPYFAGAAYDAVYLLTNAVKNYGENTDKIRDYLYGLTEYKGAIGNYHFDKNGDVVGITLVLKKIQDGKVVEIK